MSTSANLQICRSTQISNDISDYDFHATIFTKLDCIKYLNAFIDNFLYFSTHISETHSKANSMLHLLMLIIKKAKCLTRAIAYNAIC